MEYAIIFVDSALHEFRALPPKIKTRLKIIIEDLKENPRPEGIKKIHGAENLYRLRVSSYRLVYEINDSERTIRINRVRHRREAYR